MEVAFNAEAKDKRLNRLVALTESMILSLPPIPSAHPGWPVPSYVAATVLPSIGPSE